MQDLIDQLIVYLKGIWVNKWVALLIAWLICLVGWPFVLKMPDRYIANAKVYVDTQSLLSPLLRGLTIQTNPTQQVQLIVKTLFTRPNLEKIARLSDLDIQAKSAADFEAIINDLATHLTLNRAGRDNIYSIAYQSRSAEQAKNVVQATLTSLVENTLGDKREDSNTATNFLDRQIEEYEARLNQADNELKEFKKKNYDLMTAGGDFYARIEALKSKIQTIELELKEASTRRNSIKKQLEGELPSFGIMDESLVSGPQEIGSSYDARIHNLQTKLDELRLKYTDLHPDIREAQRILDDLEKKREAEIEERRQQLEKANYRNQAGINENPVYQELKISLAREETNVQSLRVRLEEFRGQLTELEKKVNTIPEIEAKLKALERGYGITQQKYNELLSRREQAHLSQEAEVSADSFQFRVIDPPRLPSSASGPNRPAFLSGVLGAGLTAGLAMAFLMGQIRPVFTSTRQLNAVTGFPVLGAVTIINDPQLFAKKRKRALIYLLAALCLLLLYAGLMALQLFPEVNQALIDHLPDLPSKVGEIMPFAKQLAAKVVNFF